MPKVIFNKGHHKIIKAATSLFVKNGFNGTSLRDIANKANVPVSLIYHYFENKTHLWKEVKLAFFNGDDWQEKEVFEKCKTFEDFIKAFVEHRIDFLSRNPDMLRLFDWQRLEDKKSQLLGVNIPNSRSSRKNFNDYLTYFRTEGEVNETLTDHDILGMVLGLLFGPFIRTGKSHFQSKKEQCHYIQTVSQMLVQTLVKKACA